MRPKTVKLNKILSIVLFLVRSIVLSKIWSKSVCGWERGNDDGTTKACQEKRQGNVDLFVLSVYGTYT